MIFEYTFPFGISNLTIKFSKKVSLNYLEEITFFLNNFQNEFNNNVTNSSAYKLNNSQPGLPIIIDPTFLNFFEVNSKYSLLNRNFDPFYSLNKKDNLKYNINELFYILKEDNAIIKLKDFFFDTSILSKHYILNLLKKFIKEKKLDNYLMNTDNMQASFGKLKWKTNFFVQDISDFVHMKLQNKYAIFENVENLNIKDSTFKKSYTSSIFGTQDDIVNTKDLIIIGDNLCDLKFYSVSFNFTNNSIDNLEKLARDYTLEFIIIDENNKIVNIF